MITPLMGSTVAGRPARVAVCEGGADNRIAKSPAPIQTTTINEVFTEGLAPLARAKRDFVMAIGQLAAGFCGHTAAEDSS